MYFKSLKLWLYITQYDVNRYKYGVNRYKVHLYNWVYQSNFDNSQENARKFQNELLKITRININNYVFDLKRNKNN